MYLIINKEVLQMCFIFIFEFLFEVIPYLHFSLLYKFNPNEQNS
jgi:hypothetical protein